MSSIVADPPVSTSTQVFTKEELDALRRALAAQRFTGEGESPPQEGEPQGDTPWQDDVDSLIRFLNALRKIMQFLIEHRVLLQARAAFQQVWPEVESNIDDAILELRSIDSASHPLYAALRRLGLSRDALKLKLGELADRIANGPIAGVLEMFDRIMGSLFKVLSQLEPVKEFKETLESRINHGADQEIIDLNLLEG